MSINEWFILTILTGCIFAMLMIGVVASLIVWGNDTIRKAVLYFLNKVKEVVNIAYKNINNFISSNNTGNVVDRYRNWIGKLRRK